MRKILSILSAILLAIAVLGLVLFWPHDQGPIYDGKPVGYWLAHPMTNQAAIGRARGGGPASGGGGGKVLNFPKFDSNAVPYIAQVLESKDGRIKRLYISAWEKSPPAVRKFLPELVPLQIMKRNALVALGQMGPDAKPAIPAMLRCINDDDVIVSLSAVINLGNMNARDKEVRAALTVAAMSTNSTVSKFANDALRRGDYQMTPYHPVPQPQ